MTNDAAVAWMGPSGHLIDNARFQSRLDGTPDFGDLSGYQPLVPATTVAELRDNAAKWKSLHDAMVLVHDVQERRIGRMTAQLEAAERRVAELEAFVTAVRTECFDYWNDPRTEFLTETQANARRAARSGGGG